MKHYWLCVDGVRMHEVFFDVDNPEPVHKQRLCRDYAEMHGIPSDGVGIETYNTKSVRYWLVSKRKHLDNVIFLDELTYSAKQRYLKEWAKKNGRCTINGLQLIKCHWSGK